MTLKDRLMVAGNRIHDLRSLGETLLPSECRAVLALYEAAKEGPLCRHCGGVGMRCGIGPGEASHVQCEHCRPLREALAAFETPILSDTLWRREQEEER